MSRLPDFWWTGCRRSGAIAAATLIGGSAVASGQSPPPPPAAQCSLPGTTTVETSRVRLPVTAGTDTVTLVVDGQSRGWRRDVDNRGTVADFRIDPKLEAAKPHALAVRIVRRPLPAEADSLGTWLDRRVALARPLDLAALERAVETELAPACGAWNVSTLAEPPASLRLRDAAWDTLASRRRGAGEAAAALSRRLAALTQAAGPVAALRREASDPKAGTLREIRVLDDLLAAPPTDTGAAAFSELHRRLTRATDLLANWHARRPPKVSAGTLEASRQSVTTAAHDAASLAEFRALLPGAQGDSARANHRLSADLRAAFAKESTIELSLAGTVSLPEPDAGRLRIGAGLHYTAPLREPIFGHPGAVNRIFPDLFVHWSPATRGTRRPFTVDFGLALNTVGRQHDTRDLFWRSSLLVGLSVHPRGLVRIGAGTQIVRERVAGDHDRLCFPIYLALSVFQFRP